MLIVCRPTPMSPFKEDAKQLLKEAAAAPESAASALEPVQASVVEANDESVPLVQKTGVRRSLDMRILRRVAQ